MTDAVTRRHSTPGGRAAPTPPSSTTPTSSPRPGSTPCSARPARRPRVRTVATEPVGTGQMAATVRARLGLGDGGERTVVVKYARGDVESAMAAMAYAKEVAFYAELGDRVAARTPGCHVRRDQPRAPRASCSCSRTWPTPPGRPDRRLPGRPRRGRDREPRRPARADLVRAGAGRPAVAGRRRRGVPITGDFMAPVIAAGRRRRSPSDSPPSSSPAEADVLAASRELLPEWMFEQRRPVRGASTATTASTTCCSPTATPGRGRGRLADRGGGPARAATWPTSSRPA